jgi:hypothetical protein
MCMSQSLEVGMEVTHDEASLEAAVENGLDTIELLSSFLGYLTGDDIPLERLALTPGQRQAFEIFPQLLANGAFQEAKITRQARRNGVHGAYSADVEDPTVPVTSVHFGYAFGSSYFPLQLFFDSNSPDKRHPTLRFYSSQVKVETAEEFMRILPYSDGTVRRLGHHFDYEKRRFCLKHGTHVEVKRFSYLGLFSASDTEMHVYASNQARDRDRTEPFGGQRVLARVLDRVKEFVQSQTLVPVPIRY